MKFSTSFAIVALASLFCGGVSLAQQQQAPAAGQTPAGLAEGMDPAIARRMAVPPPSHEQLVIPRAGNECFTGGSDQERTGGDRADTTLTRETGGGRKQVRST